jgi:hypothetical protein
MKKAPIAIVALAAALAFTPPGRAVLHSLGFASACQGGDC